ARHRERVAMNGCCRMRASPFDRSRYGERRARMRGLEHDPEKWVPVFGKDHAPVLSVTGLVRLLDDLQAIADRIRHVEAADVRQGGGPLGLVARAGEALG